MASVSPKSSRTPVRATFSTTRTRAGSAGVSPTTTTVASATTGCPAIARSTRATTSSTGVPSATAVTASARPEAVVCSDTRQTIPPTTGSSRRFVAQRSASCVSPCTSRNPTRSGPMGTSG